jgi:hypothetical protein
MSKTKNPLFFSLAKWISMTVAALALLGSIGALLAILASFGSGSFSVPRFGDEEIQSQLQRRLAFGLTEDDAQSQQEKLDITTKYGQQILSIITQHGVTAFKTDDMVNFLQRQIPVERRGDFVSGWGRFMEDGIAHVKKNNRFNDKSANLIAELYRSQFLEALQDTGRDELEKQAGRGVAITALISAALLFVVAMIVPVLVAIERNTRTPVAAVTIASTTQASTKADAPVIATATPATACPKCAAPITEGDAFCGECGGKLG